MKDCFYVSVSLRDKPHLWKLPVAVSPAGRQGIIIMYFIFLFIEHFILPYTYCY